MNTEDPTQHRARQPLPAAIRAIERTRDHWWPQQDHKPQRCLSCNADIPADYEPAEGEGLPCGH